ncbi:LbetaH domain-containing protein [Phaeovulum vinaykumarii]|uniref:Putative colanic acid biosynthesis acetyltransferase WcaF n=1 Tax=Phaeovulum vinaykumarii TaxID=407234 RepID=A0A1N7N318_9RHOB|nr:hypothetical protein [Phaeovulum vinaykumarii]SIS92776.1 putative colanic acid biosynthesis acetyltransferase WcaF [Phaeovulum vinaykumarii]SOC19061.1 putative colanic acid biosynthesis acetyltransferase WcaF [Phaeovulum vinaykumarii]
MDAAPVLPSRAPSFPLRHRLLRLIWMIVWALGASWTPKKLVRWRRFLLRLFGASMADRTDVRGSARVWYPPWLRMERATVLAEGVICYNMAPITIRENTIISQRAFLCAGTHDYTRGSHPLVTRPIEIGPHAWVCAESFVGPGAVVSEGCVVGARAVVNGRLAPWGVYAGNPATRIKERQFDAGS